jgi:RNA polymerase sigma-70 factor (ECF subfamily)
MNDEDKWPQWMALAQGGDGAVYQQLLASVLPRVRAIVGRRVKDPDQAEDVVQEVLLSVHKNRHTYDPNLKFGPWLHIIAERRTVDYLRKVYRLGARELLVDEYPETFLADGTNTIEDEAIAFDDVDRLKAAMEHLPLGQRQAVELLKLKELSLKEASKVSGLTVASLKTSMHRALKTLRAEMSGSDKI